MNIVVVGTGYVGSVTAACLAWLGNDVVGIDSDVTRVEQLEAGQLPFYEPGLPELLTETRGQDRLRFTSEPEEAFRTAEVVFLCVGTPWSPTGAADLRQVDSAVEGLVPHLREGMTVVSKSTVPVGTAEQIAHRLREARPDVAVSVAANPEFLREGSAVGDFLHPDRVILGGDRPAIDRLLSLFRPILEQALPGGSDRRPDVVLTDSRSAEMIKYAANTFLAMRVSWANEIANLSELLGADVRTVLPAVGADHRVGSAYLQPGLGWGGSCLPKDVAALIAMGSKGGYDSQLLRAVEDVNRRQRTAVLSILSAELGALDGRRIAILGLAFKPGTDDVREAPSIEVIERLASAGARVTAYDPVVKELPERAAGASVADDPYVAAEGADAVIVATEWPEFLEIDFAALSRRMAGTLVIDGRDCLDLARAAEAGLRVLPVRGIAPGPNEDPGNNSGT